jgi:hypothetical protein
LCDGGKYRAVAEFIAEALHDVELIRPDEEVPR